MIEFRFHVESLEPAGLPRRDKLTILRGQLTILRLRAEQGIAISIECIARAERLAQSLEELAA
jgi:hypothetical protein